MCWGPFVKSETFFFTGMTITLCSHCGFAEWRYSCTDAMDDNFLLTEHKQNNIYYIKYGTTIILRWNKWTELGKDHRVGKGYLKSEQQPTPTISNQRPTSDTPQLQKKNNNKHRQLNPTINSQYSKTNTRQPTTNNLHPTNKTNTLQQTRVKTEIHVSAILMKIHEKLSRYWCFHEKSFEIKITFLNLFFQNLQCSFHWSQSWCRQYLYIFLFNNVQHYQLQSWTHIDKLTREPITDNGDQ